MISIVEELEALYEEQSEGEQSDFISKFDLIAGTSVGGCGALTMNQTSTTRVLYSKYTFQHRYLLMSLLLYGITK